MRDTHNVVATVGEPDAEHTVLLIAHHDAAHWSLVFHPGVGPFIGERWPKLLELSDNTPPLMFPIFGGPVLVALGALTGRRGLRRVGTGMSLATAAAMAEIGSRSTVPGANDNLTGVATLLGVARTLREHPVTGLRVILLSTGAEESFMEGMQGFARRHFASLPTDRTHVICIDTVGSPELLSLEGEGMLWMREYPAAFKDLVSEVAAERGITLHRGMRFRNATDGLLALKAGYPSVMIGSMNKYKVPSNYHWPTDIADNVNYGTVADCVRLCDGVVRRLARVTRRAPAGDGPG
jgi:putative aminopeptidase FrvX